MLEILKAMLGISDTSKDTLLGYLIDNAEAFAVSYCGLSEYTTALDSVVIKMVLEDYNKLGSEGINSKSFSGLSESYTEDYSAAIYTILKRNRRARFI